LAPRDSLEGPAGYFSFHYQGLTDEDTEDIKLADGFQVNYNDVEAFSHTLDVRDFDDFPDDTDTSDEGGIVSPVNEGASDTTVYFDAEGHPVEVDWDSSAATATLSYKSWSQDVDLSTVDDPAAYETGYGFSVDVNVDDVDTAGDGTGTDGNNDLIIQSSDDTTLDTQHGSTIQHDDGTGWTDDTNGDGGVVVDEGGSGVQVFADFDGSTTDEELVELGDDNDFSATNVWALSSENSQTRTNFGSVVKTGSDLASATVTVPEERLQVQHALGALETTSGGDETYEAIGERGALPNMARLDGEVTESVRSNNHLVLVGGPAVNTLTETLHDDGALDLSDVADAESGAVLQVVEDAFAEGNHALVVAGYAADDTRSASQYLANYADHEQALSDAGDRMVLTEADYPAEQ
jgi:hypothetical protein